jgi:hypothetical protein
MYCVAMYQPCDIQYDAAANARLENYVILQQHLNMFSKGLILS